MHLSNSKSVQNEPWGGRAQRTSTIGNKVYKGLLTKHKMVNMVLLLTHPTYRKLFPPFNAVVAQKAA